MNDIERLECALAELHERRHCLLVPRGATAIYIALQVCANGRAGKVAMPSVICLSPPAVTVAAGLEPLYCDVRLDDLNIDVSHLDRLLTEHQDVHAVLVPHMYGRPGDLETIVRVARRHGVPLIEDAAQAVGGSYLGRPLGSFGDMSVLSFGHAKILDVGGLGALLFDDDSLVEQTRSLRDRLPPRSPRYSALSEAYRKAYYALARLFRADPDMGRLYLGFPNMFRDLYVYGGIEATLVSTLADALPSLPAEVEARNRNAELYRARLVDPHVRHLSPSEDGVAWRFSFLVDLPDTFAIAEEARSCGIDVSNWYPAVHQMLCTEPPHLPVAEYAGVHVFNLWVDSGLSAEDVDRNADVFMKVVNRHVTG